jgi:hypothetical protein
MVGAGRGSAWAGVCPVGRGQANDHPALTGPPWRATRWEADEAPGTDPDREDSSPAFAVDGDVNAAICKDHCGGSPDGTWTGTFRVPRAYLAASAELAYAGNVHVAQDRTVDTAHLLVTDSLSRQAPYVGMTRGRESNTAHVVTGNTTPPGRKPYQQATPETVLAGIIGRDDCDLSATEQIRQAQDQSGGTGHLVTLWSAAIRQTLHPDIDQQIKARLTATEAWRYNREHARKALHQRLRAAQLAGHDTGP